jgi:hypothetical protein
MRRPYRLPGRRVGTRGACVGQRIRGACATVGRRVGIRGACATAQHRVGTRGACVGQQDRGACATACRMPGRMWLATVPVPQGRPHDHWARSSARSNRPRPDKSTYTARCPATPSGNATTTRASFEMKQLSNASGSTSGTIPETGAAIETSLTSRGCTMSGPHGDRDAGRLRNHRTW